MVDERGLVALLYRADWRKLSLSGEVHGESVPLISVVTEHLQPGEPFPPPPPFAPHPGSSAETDMTLLVAPGKRFRIASQDGQLVQGCDGERVWEWRGERPPDADIRIYGDLEPPVPGLLEPSWLLSGYDLAIEGDATACGRSAIRVAATARAHDRDRIVVPPFRGSPMVRADRVIALVDAELGILLRRESWSGESRRGEQASHIAEFRSLTMVPEADPGQFAAPPGSVFSDGSWPWSLTFPFGRPGREIAKTAAGLAAAGLGAVIRCTPRRRPDPFARATEEAADPDAALPRDDGPAPDAQPGPDASPISDEMLHLLYRSGTGEPRFTATLHEWIDAEALLEAVPDSARKTGFGGVGFLVDTLRDAALDSGTVHLVSSVRLGGWDRYRIDAAGPERAGHGWGSRRHRPRTDACDGQRRWQVYEDRVAESPAAPLPDEVSDLADGSWLLGAALSGGEEIAVRGRRAYRVVGRSPRRDSWRWLSMLDIRSYPAVAAVDAESGRLLRLTRYAGGKPVACHELRDIQPDGSGDFGFEPPAGLRVVREPSEWPTEQPANPAGFMAKAAADAARGFFGSFRGTRR